MIVDLPSANEGWINAHHAGGMAIRYAGVYIDKSAAQEEGKWAAKRSGWRCVYRIHAKRKHNSMREARRLERLERISEYLEIISGN